jgi:hypothetical protein
LRIHSKSLHDFLTTFFRYTRICKLNPPLTNEIKNWHNNGVDLKRAIICPNLQSDGSITKRILFCGNNKILHDYFVDAMYYEYDILPTSYFLQSSNCVPSTYYELSTTKILDDILKVVGNTKTHPATGQSVKEYLEEPQPNLDYLINASKIEQLIALRIWASTEGCISIGGGKGKLRPYFMIACSHPTLISQLKKIAGRHDLHMLIKRSRKTWSGLSGIYSTSRKTLINFLKLGGFIKGVKISSRSRYHEGISKDILIVGILEYIRQRYMNKWPNELPKNVHHHNINKIIQNKEYQSAKYYIDLFS